MMLSFTLQAVALVVMVVLSIFTVDKLGAVSLPRLMPPAPRAPKVVQIVAVAPKGTATAPSLLQVPTRPVFQPSRIPTRVADIVDAPQLAPPQAIGVGSGTPEGVPQGLVFLGGNERAAATPPPPAPASTLKTAEPQKPIRLGGKILEAKLVKRVMPVYPPLARQARVAGTVRLEGVISRDGRVVNLQVISGHPLLVGSAVQAVREWIYSPTLLNDEPVEVIAPIEVRFLLGGN